MPSAIVRKKILNLLLITSAKNCGDFAQLLAENIKQKGLKPKAVLLTHGHFDHAMAAQELAGIFGVKIYAHEAEKETLEQSGLNASGKIFSLSAKTFTSSPG